MNMSQLAHNYNIYAAKIHFITNCWWSALQVSAVCCSDFSLLILVLTLSGLVPCEIKDAVH